MTLFLDEHHMQRLHEGGHVTMGHYVDAIERAYREQGLGRVVDHAHQADCVGAEVFHLCRGRLQEPFLDDGIDAGLDLVPGGESDTGDVWREYR